MTRVPDEKQRARALTDLKRTLLVEASAGTGKTSLLAGRVAMLLSARCEPASIAAITFTERAAAELRTRVDKFAAALLIDEIPKDLAPAFAETPLKQEQQTALVEGKHKLGELTASTIHAFCLTILQSYAVEARIDPGAVVIDGEETELAFQSVFEDWLGRRLGYDANPDDPIVAMASHNPGRAMRTLRSLARFRRRHPDARPLPPPSYVDAAHEYVDAVAEYRRWINSVPAPDQAVADVTALEELATFFAPATVNLPFAQLLPLVNPSNAALLGWDRRVFYVYKPRRRDWARTAGAEGDQLGDAGGVHYNRCSELFNYLVGTIADTLLAQFFDESTKLVEEFEAFKREAAFLDFDDILFRTRALLRGSDNVRQAVAARYQHILVDEFQDTDPIQAEILFLIAGEAGPSPEWDKRLLRAGALFLVGDPKQAIYRFRGADLKTYLRAKAAIRDQFPDNVLQISANFRSGGTILEHVDQCFEARLKRQHGSYTGLQATIAADPARIQAIAKFSYGVRQTEYVDDVRIPEANAVAELCANLIGNLRVRRSNGDIVPAEPGDIALLAPTGTDLWIYERALEGKELPVTSQAGKNFYRRQEAHDFVALVRALADNRDTLALGALLRGPLIGLSERELLDVTAALRQRDEGAVLSLRTDLALVTHPLAHAVMTILQDLWRKRRGTTPHALISEAIDRLRVMTSITTRGHDQRDRAIANLSLLLERARRYDVRGLKQLAIDLGTEWSSHSSFDEAPADRTGESINIITVHKAKGLEWPIVIPINLVSMPRPLEEFFFNAEHNTVHWTFGEIASSTLAAAVVDDKVQTSEERERLLYVACTRALDLLILPSPSWWRDDSWFSFFDLGQEHLAEIRAMTPIVKPEESARSPGAQTKVVFDAEAARIKTGTHTIIWQRPSLDDPDRELLEMATVDAAGHEDDPQSRAIVIGAGRLRGVVLHRLMEELLTDLLVPEVTKLTSRAELLIDQIAAEGDVRPDPGELGATALATFQHDDLQGYIGKLVPEFPLYGERSEEILVSARADAVAIEKGKPIAVFDWKSDVSPSVADREAYDGQLLQYLELIQAPKGAVVYMTTREVHWVHLSRQ